MMEWKNINIAKSIKLSNMRIRLSKCFSCFLILIPLVILFVASWKHLVVPDIQLPQRTNELRTTVKPRDRIQESNKFLKKSMTIIFRDFYHFDNDLKTSINHVLNLIPDLKILIISDELPYPPMNIFSNETKLIYKDNVKFLSLDMDITKSESESNPLNYIATKYVLFLPDSLRLTNGRQLFVRLIKSLGSDRRDGIHRKILIVPFKSNQKAFNYCFQITTEIPDWTLEYEVKNDTKNCNLVRMFIFMFLL